MIRINLLGKEAEDQAKGLRAIQLPELSLGTNQAGIAAMFTVALLVIALSWWMQSRQLGRVRVELAGLKAEEARLQEVSAGVHRLRERTERMRQKLQVIVELKANQSGPVMLLDQVSRLMSDGLWLTRLELSDGEVTIRGAALSDVAIADFVDHLEGSTYFDDVFLRTLGDSGDALSFQITLRFEPVRETPATESAAALAAAGGGAS